MGSEFLGKQRQTIVKHIDRKRVELATRDLFTIVPQDRRRSFIASVAANTSVAKGEVLIVESVDGVVKLLRGLSVVGSLDGLPEEIVATIKETGGAAKAIVERIHALSKRVSVAIC